MRMIPMPALVLGGAAVFARGATAQPKDFKPPTHQVAPALDRIAMTEFVSDPATIPPNATQITLKVTVKNLTAGPQAETLNGLKLRVYRTTPQPDVLELETTVVNLAAGATQSVSQRVNVAPGVREYFARVDVDDVLHEPIVQRANNEKRLKITIPFASRDQAPPPGSKETHVLDYDKAKSSGAQFGASLEGDRLCMPGPQVFGAPNVGVAFQLACGTTGGRSTPEAYVNFRLKNGWKVKSYDVVDKTTVNADWEWTKTPAIGSDDPSSKVHLWANMGGTVRVSVKIEIEGPAGTNPYQ